MKFLSILLIIFSLRLAASPYQTIAQKKESLKSSEEALPASERISQINALFAEKKSILKTLYDRVQLLYRHNAPKEAYRPVLSEIAILKEEISEIEFLWREESKALFNNEEYSIWHQPETTIAQLVMDYGSLEYIYLIPEDIGQLSCCFLSKAPVPRECWDACLTLVLRKMGISIKELTPIIRELYYTCSGDIDVNVLLEAEEELDYYPPLTRVCFVLAPVTQDHHNELLFLQKFSNPSQTQLEFLGGKFFITSTVATVKELLRLHQFLKKEGNQQEFQVVTFSKIDALVMCDLLNQAFDLYREQRVSTLKIVPMNSTNQLFLIGSKSDLSNAIKLINEIESQTENPQKKTVFWYQVKHSKPEELAIVLGKVYDLLILCQEENSHEGNHEASLQIEGSSKRIPLGQKIGSEHPFIIDTKTGALIMVLEQDIVPKIKELLTKLDVPKKMVKIDVLFFEKKLSQASKFGLNLLRLGTETIQKATNLSWNSKSSGLLEFLISRNKTNSGIPSYDLSYQFLLSQEDIHVNASPSVTTMNQTPAFIAIVDERSVDGGVNEKNNKVYNRAEYGITIQITPTINFDEKNLYNEAGFITLETDITFDTTKENEHERPVVTRRHIKNNVRIADGQTVILGGLRHKTAQDHKESLPFLGEIPGIGKLFSQTAMNDDSTEMFIFITPKIISGEVDDMEKMRVEDLKKRPGDVPEFLHTLVKAKEEQKRRLLEGTLSTLFGRGAMRSEKCSEFQGRS